MFCLILFFISSVYKYYSSNYNVKTTSSNRVNIDQILKDKIFDLPVLMNDTKDSIEFNDSFQNEINKEKTRSFWNLLKSK